MIVRSQGEQISFNDGGLEPMNVERVVEAILILVICITIIFSNVLIIGAVLNSPSPKEAMDFYILSIAVADLLCGLLIVPLSVYPAVAKEWIYGDFVCRVSGFLELTLWSVCLYTFMWISVDRYLAIRKPLRYDVIQTRTRCQCWMVFTWLTSLFLCCPPLLGFSKGRFYSDGYICLLDYASMVPYSITLAALVLAPSIITISYTYFYIFSTMYKLRQCLTKEEKEYATAVNENLASPDHIMAFVLILLFAFSWLPWFGLQVYENIMGTNQTSHNLHFWLLWLGISDCTWKLLVYVAMSPKIRLGLRFFCMSMCCRSKSRHQLVV